MRAWPAAHDRTRHWDVGGGLRPHGVGAAGDAAVDGGAVVVDGVVEGSGWWAGQYWGPETFGLVKRWAWGRVDACRSWANPRAAVTRWAGVGQSACWEGPRLLLGPSSVSYIWTFCFETRFLPEFV